MQQTQLDECGAGLLGQGQGLGHVAGDGQGLNLPYADTGHPFFVAQAFQALTGLLVKRRGFGKAATLGKPQRISPGSQQALASCA